MEPRRGNIIIEELVAFYWEMPESIQLNFGRE